MRPHRETKGLLEAYGIPLAAEVLASSVDEAVEAAGRVAFPDHACVVKLVSPGHSHKTEAGFVKLELRSPGAVRAACLDLLSRLGPGEAYEGILVQPMIRSNRELILGARLDPQFGPLVAFGPGGILVGILGGVDFLAPPFTRSQAIGFMARNAASPMLGPLRGSPAADLDSLATCLLALGRLIAENESRVASVDINPLVTVPESGALVALDFRSEGVRE
jgi:succinyl-CoA synthetase beta subunit